MWNRVYFFMAFLFFLLLSGMLLEKPEELPAFYTDDRLCRDCHREIYDNYQGTGMANSFFRPGTKTVIEHLDTSGFVHSSGKKFQYIQRDSQWYFVQEQLDKKGNPIHQFERKVDWILGSGNKSRTYLYQTESGELFQFPLAWYSGSRSWGMAPGFASQPNPTVVRPVTRECMFCHNAYPADLQKNSRHWELDIFDKELPQGIGCQRCHGPGSRHLEWAIDGNGNTADRTEVNIVNPSKLTPGLRDDVCNQCHLQPAVTMFGPRKYDVQDYDFRPGQKLSEYLLHVDIVQPALPKEDRFEINHHAYRLYQSTCYRESQGKLSCISCHDPHKKSTGLGDHNRFNGICLQCHQAHQSDPVAPAFDKVSSTDCVTCHMPKRRTQDVVEVTVTDHFIYPVPPHDDLLRPLSEQTHTVSDLYFWDKNTSLSLTHSDIYRASVVLRAQARSADALEYLENKILDKDFEAITPYYDLVKGQVSMGKYPEAIRSADHILRFHPQSDLAHLWRGLVKFRLKGVSEALSDFRVAAENNPLNANAFYNLGVTWETLAVQSDTNSLRSPETIILYENAIKAFQQTCHLRDNFAAAFYHLGQCYSRMSIDALAETNYLKALAIQTDHTQAYLGIMSLYHRQDKYDQARIYLEHGIQNAGQPQLIRNLAREWGWQID